MKGKERKKRREIKLLAQPDANNYRIKSAIHF